MRQPPRSFSIVAMIIGAIAVLAFPSASTAQTYTNPVANADVPRPYIVKDGSTYYAFAGKTRIPVRTSTDLKTWGSASDTLSSPGAWASGWGSVQSAAVWKVGTTWIMYYAAKSSTENRQCIGVATASAPGGPYTAQSSPLACNPGSGFKGAQDPAIFLSGSIGGPTAELVWVGLDVTSGDPTMILSRALASNGLGFASGSSAATLLTPQSTGWEEGTLGSPSVVYDPSSGDTSLAKVYLVYSGNQETSARNAMGWATCSTASSTDGTLTSCRREILGTWMDSLTDTMAPGDATVFSDGSNSWLAYSAYSGSCNSSGSCSGTRKLRIDKLCFMAGFPRTNGPSLTAQSLSRSSTCSSDVQPASGSPSLTEIGLLPLNFGTARDDGVSDVVGGESLWTFGDTLGGPIACTFDLNGDDVLCSNTAGILDVPGGPDPQEIVEFPGALPQLWVPYTAAELADPDFTPTTRIVHWASGVQSRPDGTALLYYGRGFASLPEGGGLTYDSLGSGIACMSIDGSCPIPGTSSFANVSRLGEIFDGDEPQFDDGPVVRGGYVYLYANFGLVARVPLGQEAQRSSYRYWDGTGWSTDIEEAVDTGRTVTGTVAFNPYLGKYLSVGLQPYDLLLAHQNFTLQTADLPQGPWSAVIQLQVPDRAPGVFFSNYAMMEHHELAMQHGKKIMGSYYHSGKLRLVEIDFP